MSVTIGSSVLDTKLGCGGKDLATVASGVVDCWPNASSSPSKRLSPADVSGTNEEWETASEGSDGGLRPRRLTTPREDATKYSVKCNADVVRPDSGSCSRGFAVSNSSHHSPCASGVPSLAAHTDFEHSWKEAGSRQCHADVGNCVAQWEQSVTNTDSADVAINHSTSQSLTPSSLLFAVSFSDPRTKQPSLHDALARFVLTLNISALVDFERGEIKLCY